MEATKKKSGGLKEVWRKFLVALKRRPQMIPLAVLVVAFVFYSLNLMHISDTTARIQGPGMGLAGFATMLFSMLSFMCFLNAFPYRKKPNIPMLVLMFVLVGIVIFADAYYISAVLTAVTRADNPIAVTENTIYIMYAEWYLRIHIGIPLALPPGKGPGDSAPCGSWPGPCAGCAAAMRSGALTRRKSRCWAFPPGGIWPPAWAPCGTTPGWPCRRSPGRTPWCCATQ